MNTTLKQQKIICNTAICIMLLIVTYFIMISAHWSLSDNILLIKSTAVGKTFTYWVGSGRFPPLGNFDYNILNFIPYGYTVNAHFFSNVVIFVAFIYALWLLLNDDLRKDKSQSLYINLLFIIITPVLSGCTSVFIDVHYPERLMCLTLTLFMLCYKKALDTSKIKYYVLAFLLAAFTTYHKEPMCGVLLIIVFVNLVFNWKGVDKKERIFYFLLIFNTMVFLALWYFIAVRGFHSDEMYGHDLAKETNIIKIMIRYGLFIPAFVLGAIRAYHVLFRKDKSVLFYDSLLFAGIGYACAMLWFGFASRYYYIPAHILILPGFAYWAKSLYANRRKLLFAVLISSCLLMTAVMSISVVQIFQWHYRVSIHLEENIRKLDEYIREDKRIVWLDDRYHISKNKYEVEVFLNYLNTNGLGGKPYIREKDIQKFNNVIEDYTQNSVIDRSAIYISGYDDLPVRDKRFAGFVPVGEIANLWATYTYYRWTDNP